MEKLVGRGPLEFPESVDNGLSRVIGSLERVVMRAAERLRDDSVDDSELEQRRTLSA